ncbi:MAG TPA: hypothetical protein VE753_07760, partial [Gaiellaceae bacterium]|nr:hypothetical protein [Gaiellaceae bacterium]
MNGTWPRALPQPPFEGSADGRATPVYQAVPERFYWKLLAAGGERERKLFAFAAPQAAHGAGR